MPLGLLVRKWPSVLKLGDHMPLSDGSCQQKQPVGNKSKNFDTVCVHILTCKSFEIHQSHAQKPWVERCNYITQFNKLSGVEWNHFHKDSIKQYKGGQKSSQTK